MTGFESERKFVKFVDIVNVSHSPQTSDIAKSDGDVTCIGEAYAAKNGLQSRKLENSTIF